MNLDIAKIIADIKIVAARIVELKRILRRRWERPMRDEQRALLRLKRQATELCVLRAHLRGRRHLVKPPWWWSGGWDPDTAAATIASRIGLAYAPAAPAAQRAEASS